MARAQAEQAAIARAEADRAVIDRAERAPAQTDAATGRVAEGSAPSPPPDRSARSSIHSSVAPARQPRAPWSCSVRGDRFQGWRGFDPAFAVGDRLDIAATTRVWSRRRSNPQRWRPRDRLEAITLQHSRS